MTNTICKLSWLQRHVHIFFRYGFFILNCSFIFLNIFEVDPRFKFFFHLYSFVFVFFFFYCRMTFFQTSLALFNFFSFWKFLQEHTFSLKKKFSIEELDKSVVNLSLSRLQTSFWHHIWLRASPDLSFRRFKTDFHRYHMSSLMTNGDALRDGTSLFWKECKCKYYDHQRLHQR